MASLWNTITNSGVGWFNDILTIEIFFDADLEEASTLPFTVKRPSPDGNVESIVENYRPVFAAGAHVTGFIRVTPPPGRSITHNGIMMKLESGFYALEEIATRELYEEEVDLLPAGSIAGVEDFPFVFRGVGRSPLHESYEGDLFSIRHTVTAVVLRPWYTFEVTTASPFAVQRVFDIPRKASYAIDHPSSTSGKGEESVSVTQQVVGAPKSDSTPAAAHAQAAAVEEGAAPHTLTAQLAMYTEQSLAIDDLDDGARVTLRYDKGVYELSEHLNGTIVFEGVKAPILLVRLAVVRIEYADGEVHDSVIFDESILDARRWRARKEQAEYAARMSAADTGAAVEDAGDAAGQEEIAEEGGIVAAAAVRPVAVAVEGGGDAEEGDGEEEEESWVPTAEDLEADDVDPDLPVIGDTSLTVDLDFAQIGVTPTYVIDVEGDVLGDAAQRPTSAPPKSEGDVPDNEVSVRYFLRITVYTSFEVESRRWNAAEIILHRDRLYGTPVAKARLPRALPKPKKQVKTDVSAASAASPPMAAASKPGDASAPGDIGIPKLRALSTGSLDSTGATSPHLTALQATSGTPPSTLPYSKSLFGLQRSSSGREVMSALTPKGSLAASTAASERSSSMSRSGAAVSTSMDDVDAESGLAAPVDLAGAMTRAVVLNEEAPTSSRAAK